MINKTSASMFNSLVLIIHRVIPNNTTYAIWFVRDNCGPSVTVPFFNRSNSSFSIAFSNWAATKAFSCKQIRAHHQPLTTAQIHTLAGFCPNTLSTDQIIGHQNLSENLTNSWSISKNFKRFCDCRGVKGPYHISFVVLYFWQLM